MDKTKSKLAAFFDNDDEESSFLQKPVDDMKLSQYTAGIVRKSRREKEQEAADAKKREEEANAAQVYAEYVNAFEGEEVSRRTAGSAFVRADSKTTYAPSVSSSERRVSRRSPSPSAASVPKPKGKRAMDSFLEEIKREQAEREAKYSRHSHGGHGRSATAMAAYEGQSGSKDRGDPQTTNLFVANLPQHVTEQGLGKFFARAGPVGSVKIMWPRTDLPPGPGVDSSRRAKGIILNGFVSFMNRRDAEDALREFDGYDWGGSVLRVGWSKAVPIASKPLYVVTSNRIRDSRSRSRSRSRSPERNLGRNRDTRSRRSRSPSWERNRSRSPRRRRSYSRTRRYSSSRSRSPRRGHSRSPQRSLPDEGEAVTDTFIRAVAFEVKGHDTKYEETLREREKANPKYNFLLQRDHRRHAYYKGLIESQEPFKPAFDDEGYNSVYSSDSAEESEREQTRKSALGTAARKRFEAMLRALSGKRGEIARCMTFCLEHAEAAHEVADIIVSSLLVDGTAVPRKVARLHLICDILHNSAASVPSAWKYRQEFQSRLGIVFDHLANIYHSFPGRITADLFKKQITTVVDIWEDWIVFPPDFTMELRTRLEGAVVPTEDTVDEEEFIIQPPAAETFSSRFKTSTFQLAAPNESISAQASDGEPMDVSSDGDQEAGDLDGEPVEDLDIDGIPIDDIDGEPVDKAVHKVEDDVDGEPIRDDVDGVPVDDDIDGLPIDESS
ncbi:hypothetical protein CVT25_011033 [Psilocybe cyanescens]|uniref:CID domain-containing protein n=1 Tax=Psilocybe cyanescens TaxID=93625 RepID=A0A409WFB1_PSICY|nr:hypothetical protein CVT25_011033 [Psilocybe cyanescens]